MMKRNSNRRSLAKGAVLIASLILLAGCCLLPACSPAADEEEATQPTTGEETSNEGTSEVTGSYDDLSGTYVTLGSSAGGYLTSASLTDSEMILTGDLHETTETGAEGPSIGNKTWVFEVDENTEFGYTADAKFHEQSREEFAETLESLAFPALSLTIEDGTIVQARIHS